MNFTPIRLEEVPAAVNARKQREGPSTLVADFLANGAQAALIEKPEGRSAQSVYTSLRKATKDAGGCSVRLVNDEVYLIRG